MSVDATSGLSRPGLIEACPAPRCTRAATAPFPGHCARASLKHVEHVPVGVVFGSVPGPSRPASLKRKSPNISHFFHLPTLLFFFSVVGCTPGPSCPGLIEAARRHRGRNRGYGRSRASRPGRIEAGIALAAIGSGCSSPFPGVCARASLKHDVGIIGRGDRGPVPGRLRPGLIEAIRTRPRRLTNSRRSRAFAPGPH